MLPNRTCTVRNVLKSLSIAAGHERNDVSSSQSLLITISQNARPNPKILFLIKAMAWLFWNTVNLIINFVDFLVIHVSQGSSDIR